MKIEKLKLIKDVSQANAITHNGKFHIDEVFSTVLLCKIFDDLRLVRVSEISNKNDYKGKIVYDIGKGEFDHHQSNALTREDGVRYSSFGLLWKKYGKVYLKKINCKDVEFAWEKFDISLVKTIDKIDNFQIEKECLNNYLISSIIEGFNPNWNEDIDSDIKFKEAVEFATTIFNNEINNILSRIEAKNYLKETIELIDRYIVLKKYVPYIDYIIENDINEQIEFVIYPSKRNGYEIRTILDRNSFPKEWHDYTKEEFYSKYKISGMVYCHTNGKLCVVDSMETAIKIIELT